MSELIVTRDNLYEILDTIKHELSKGYPVKMRLEPVFTTRTKEQNAYYQVLVKRIAFQSGASTDFVKEEVKRCACLMGYPYERDADGDLLIDEKGNPIPLSSAKATISQMKILIDACFRVAQEWNFILEDER